MGCCASVESNVTYTLPGRLVEQPAKGHFSLISLNLLNEKHYTKHANNQRMPFHERYARTINFINHAANHSDVCFFSLQECNPARIPVVLATLEQAGFGLIKSADEQADDVVLLAYRMCRFAPVGRPVVQELRGSTQKPTGSKTAVMQLFECLQTKQRVAVIAVHVPYEQNASFVAGTLQRIDDLTARVPNGNYIVAGDFNTDAVQSLQNWTPLTTHLPFTAVSPHSSQAQTIDHVLCRGASLRPSTYAPTAVPLAPQLLIHQSSNDESFSTEPDKAFFSDHAAVIVSFQL